jgi:hypothetical protein
MGGLELVKFRHSYACVTEAPYVEFVEMSRN